MTLPNPIKYHLYRGQPLPEPAYYAYVLAAQGLFKWAVRPHFEASVLVAPAQVAGLPKWPFQTRLTVPQIPRHWLAAALDHACQVAVPTRVEQMYHFHYLPECGWRVSVPGQRASVTRVNYLGGEASSIVLDMHSHHTMTAHFSDTDDEDERGCRFYGVLGNIFDAPTVALRVGVWGDYQRVKFEVLFE